HGAHHAHEVGCLLKEKTHGGDVLAYGTAGSGDEDGLREIGTDPGGGVLELEPVAEDQLEATAGVVAEGFFEFGGGLGLDLAAFGLHGVADFYEPVVGQRVPAGVPGRSGGEQGYAELFGVRWCRLGTTPAEADRGEEGEKEEDWSTHKIPSGGIRTISSV